MKKNSICKLLIAVLIVDIVLCIVFVFTKYNIKATTEDLQISESSIQQICELATMDCFYHNVTEWTKGANIIGYGAKRLWIEYDGIVRVGIKADQLKTSIPDKDGIITVTIPDACILDKDLDEESLREIDSESPMLGFIPLYSSIKTQDRKEALAEAQEDMVASASENGMILDEAKARAKQIIENSLVSIGEKSGKHYKVKFVDVVEAQTTSPTEES